MKYLLLLILISGMAISKEINFNAFQVDTSISDIKPVKKEFVPEKIATVNIQNSNSDPNYIRPGSYRPLINPHVRPSSNFGTTQLEQMNQNARGVNPNM